MNPSNAPLTNSLASPPNPNPASVEFLGLNLDAFRELVVFAEVAEDFTLAIAEVNFASDGDLLVQALQNHDVSREVQFIILDFNNRESFSFLNEVTAALAGQSLEPERKPVLLVLGLATAIGVKSDYTRFLNDLNFTRDQLAIQVPYPMVLFLPDYAINLLAQYAKDLWNWKSGLFHFRTTRQRVETLQTQLNQPPTLPADSRPVKQERIQQLERLLSEQVNNGTPHPQSACIAIALELGNAYYSLSDFEQARRYYHKALDWAELDRDQTSTAQALYGLGEVHRLKDDQPKALTRFEQALELFRAVGDRLGEANTLKAIGHVLQFLNRSPEALQHYEQALALFRAIGDRLGEANTLRAIGDVLQFLNRSPEALQHYEQAMALFRATGDRLGEANTLTAIGDVLQFLDRHTEALQHYEQALALYRATGARLGEANVLQEQGKMEADLQKTVQLLLQAQSIYEAIEDRYSQCRNLINFLAKAQLAVGLREDAIRSLHRGADLATGTEFGFFRETALQYLQDLDKEATSH